MYAAIQRSNQRPELQLLNYFFLNVEMYLVSEKYELMNGGTLR